MYFWVFCLMVCMFEMDSFVGRPVLLLILLECKEFNRALGNTVWSIHVYTGLSRV